MCPSLLALRVFLLVPVLGKEMVMLLADALRAVLVKPHQGPKGFVQMRVILLFLGTSGSEKWVQKFESLA